MLVAAINEMPFTSSILDDHRHYSFPKSSYHCCLT